MMLREKKKIDQMKGMTSLQEREREISWELEGNPRIKDHQV